MEIKLPELGENIDKVDVSAVLVSEGDRVQRDQPVIEVETEKASLEVPTTHDGRVARLMVSKGDTVSVGQVILVVDSSADESVDVPAEASSADERKAKPTEEATGAETPDAPADEAGAARRSPPKRTSEERAPERDASSAADQVDPRAAAAKPRAETAKPSIGRTVAAAPSVRALARELGVDVLDVAGSGPRGRITRDDVKAHAKRLITGAGARARGVTEGVPAPSLPDFKRWGAVRVEPMDTVRRRTSEHLFSAWTTVPHVTQFDRCDVTDLETMRRDFNRRDEAEGRKLTVTAVAIKLVALALRRFPKFNASVDAAASSVVFKEYVNVGVAVDTERGLLVPVVRDADRKGLLQIVDELTDLATRAREKKIKPGEMQGATFTVSNLGGLGTTYFSPIVNWPEVAILGLGRAEIQPVHDGSQFAPRRIMPLSLSYDHRLIDGADAARFLRWVAEALEQPLLLLLQEN